MNILITNDDGIEADGLKVLATTLAREHLVWVVAPDRERSGASHSVNLHEPGRLIRRGEREYSYSGTPADCVMVSQLGLLDIKPDIVVSGINRGPNLGTDILYSGTCSAARQAALHGTPGIAVSCASRRGPFLYGAAASFILRNLEALVAHCSDSVFMNVNAPSLDRDDLEGSWAVPCLRRYHDNLRPETLSDSEYLCHLESGPVESVGGEYSDEAVTSSGRVAVTALLVHPQVKTGIVAGEIFR
jgi:5'-nucleotidase